MDSAVNDRVSDWMKVADIAREYDVPRSTVAYWFKHGVGGRRIVGARKVGHSWKCRRRDIEAFFELLTEDAIGRLPPMPEVVRSNDREHDAAMDQLRKMGVLDAPKRSKTRKEDRR